VFKDDGVETKLGPQKRYDLQLSYETIRMGERNIGRCFCTVDRDIANFHLQMERDNVEAADFSTATGDALHFRDHPGADVVLKGLGGGIPQAEQDAG
jgi:hypothetical protein